MVSVSSHLSQQGESINPDLCALLLVQMVLFSTSKADSFVLDCSSGIARTLYASWKVPSSGW